MDVQLTDKGTRTADAEGVALGEWESSLIKTMLGIAGVDDLLKKHGIVVAFGAEPLAPGSWGVKRSQYHRGLSVDFGAIESETGARLIAALVALVDQATELGATEETLKTERAQGVKRAQESRELRAENTHCMNRILQMWDAMGRKRRKRLDSVTRSYAEGLAIERDAEAREDY